MVGRDSKTVAAWPFAPQERSDSERRFGDRQSQRETEDQEGVAECPEGNVLTGHASCHSPVGLDAAG